MASPPGRTSTCTTTGLAETGEWVRHNRHMRPWPEPAPCLGGAARTSATEGGANGTHRDGAIRHPRRVARRPRRTSRPSRCGDMRTNKRGKWRWLAITSTLPARACRHPKRRSFADAPWNQKSQQIGEGGDTATQHGDAVARNTPTPMTDTLPAAGGQYTSGNGFGSRAAGATTSADRATTPAACGHGTAGRIHRGLRAMPGSTGPA